MMWRFPYIIISDFFHLLKESFSIEKNKLLKVSFSVPYLLKSKIPRASSDIDTEME